MDMVLDQLAKVSCRAMKCVTEISCSHRNPLAKVILVSEKSSKEFSSIFFQESFCVSEDERPKPSHRHHFLTKKKKTTASFRTRSFPVCLYSRKKKKQSKKNNNTHFACTTRASVHIVRLFATKQQQKRKTER